MIKEKLVFYDKSPLNNKYYLCIDHESFPFPNGTRGSFLVMLARIAGMNYTDFLRVCRDVFGATLIGKGHKYVVPYFEFNEGLNAVVKWLNTRANYIIYRHNHPYEFNINENGDPIEKIFDNGEKE